MNMKIIILFSVLCNQAYSTEATNVVKEKINYIYEDPDGDGDTGIALKNVIKDDSNIITYKKPDGSIAVYQPNKNRNKYEFEDPDGDGYAGVDSKNVIKNDPTVITYKKEDGTIGVVTSRNDQITVSDKDGKISAVYKDKDEARINGKQYNDKDPDGDGIPGRSGFDYQRFINDNKSVSIIPTSLGKIKITKDFIIITQKDGTVISISTKDGAVKNSASDSGKAITNEFVKLERNEDGTYKPIKMISDDANLVPEDFTRVTRKDEIKNCTVSVGQSIECAEGTYKFIGNNSIDKVLDNSRASTKAIENESENKRDISSKTQSK